MSTASAIRLTADDAVTALDATFADVHRPRTGAGRLIEIAVLAGGRGGGAGCCGSRVATFGVPHPSAGGAQILTRAILAWSWAGDKNSLD